MIEFECREQKGRVFGYISPDAPEPMRAIAILQIQTFGKNPAWENMSTKIGPDMELAMEQVRDNWIAAREKEVAKKGNYAEAARKRAEIAAARKSAA